MIDLDLGGACPRQPLMHVLSGALGAPSKLQGEASAPGSLNFVVMNGELLASAASLGSIAAQTGSDWLMSSYADPVTTQCQRLVLAQRTAAGIVVSDAQPCRLPGQARMLLLTNRGEAFVVDPAGRLVSFRAPLPPQALQGILRAWDEIHSGMRELAMHHSRDPECMETGIA